MKADLLHWALWARRGRWPTWAAIASVMLAVTVGAANAWYAQAEVSQVRAMEAARRHMAEVATPGNAAAAPPAESPQQHFEAVLGDRDRLQDYLRTLFDVAEKQALTLASGVYKTDTSGGFETYTVDLPVRGDYAKLKRVSEQVLLALPFSALEEIRFKRGAVNETTVEAQLRFTFYLKPSAAVAPAGSREARS